MATMNFGGVNEQVVTRNEFTLEHAKEVLKDETIAVLGYGVQGPGQALNLRDNGFRVIVGQRKDTDSWKKALADGWVPGETLFEIEEATERATIVEFLLSDAGQIAAWPLVCKHLSKGKALDLKILAEILGEMEINVNLTQSEKPVIMFDDGDDNV